MEVDESQLDGNHFVVPCSLGDSPVQTPALIDCGATGYSFVDEDFARRHHLPLTLLRKPRSLEVIDGRPILSGAVTHLAIVTLRIRNHTETLALFVTKLGHYPIVLSIPWLRKNDVTICFSRDQLSFGPIHCPDCRCFNRDHPPDTKLPIIHIGPRNLTFKAHSIQDLEALADIDLVQAQQSTNLKLAKARRPGAQPAKTIAEAFPWHSAPITVSMVAAAPFVRQVKRNKLKIFSLSLYEINKALACEKVAKATGSETANLKEIVPVDYHEFLPLFDEVIARELPPHHPYDHSIPLKEGFTPPFGPIYSLNRVELETLKTWIEDNLSKGFIRSSSSPAGAPVLFSKKADGSLRLCVDYRGLNDGMIKNRYPLPLLRDTLLRLQKAKYYTKLDVRSAYNLIRIAEGEEWKTAFRTRYGLFESLVMPFGLTNAPASFQNFINDVLHPFLDLFITAYLDDILIFSSTLKEHKQHVRQVLTRLQENGLHLAPHKCEFHRTSVKYLGFIINTKGCASDPAKITTVVEWGTKPEADSESTPAKAHKPTFGNVTDVHRFLGFANFYRRFIKDYSRIIAPLTRLTRNEIPFVWDDDCKMAVETLKTAFTTAPVLRHFDNDRQIIVEMDASDFVSAGVLSQYDDDGILHPVAFFSKKHSPAECNYEIYDKELMAIVRCFEEWCPELEGARHPIQVLSDHRNLEYFMTTKLLNRRQTRWAEFLSRFDFKIVYRSGKAGGKPDALTRRTKDLPGDGNERLLHM